MADLIISQPMTFTVDVKNGLVERPQRESLMRGDRMANRIIAELVYGSEPFDITGVTVKGKFCRPPNGDEIDLAGEAKGNVAEVQLTDQCYTSGGHYEARVILVLGGVERTVLFISGDVLKSGSGNAAGDEETGGSGGTGSGLPAGGTAGQVLVKVSSAQGDAIWKTLTAADIGARPDNWMPTAADVGALPSDGTAVNATQLNGKRADEYATVEQLNNKQFTGLVTSSTDIYARNERMYPGIDIYGTDREGNKSFQGSLRLSMNTDHDGFREVELIDSGQTKICRVLTEAYGTAADSAKLGGKEPKYYTQPRNLLDNSWWKVKKEIVNQRGQTIYTGDGYTIDRWIIWGVNGDASLTVNDSGLTFNPGSGGGTLSQKIPLGILESAKTYTLAVHKSNGETEVRTDGVTFNYNGECDLVTVLGVAETILWAALYEGSYTADNLPPYVPKGYAAELVECKRYAKMIQGDMVGMVHGYGAGKGYGTIITDGKMRIDPSIADPSTVKIINGEYYSDSFTSVKSISNIDTTENAISFWMEHDEVEAGKDYLISCKSPTLFSSDL